MLPLNNSTCAMNEDEFQQELRDIDDRFIFVVVFGGSCALFGIIFTTLLIKILFARQFRATFCLYFAFLAIFDMMILINYFLLICTGILYIYYRSFWLFKIYVAYVIPFFTLARITQHAQNLLVVAATTERCLLTIKNSNSTARESQGTNRRYYIIFGVVLLAILFRGISYWEVIVVYYPECSRFSSLKIMNSEIWNSEAAFFYKFYIEPIFLCYLPFVALCCLNVVIIFNLQEASKKKTVDSTGNAPTSEGHLQVRSATMTMCSLVTCYLISNVLNVIVSIMEQTKSPILTTHPKFYNISADLCSVLVIITCSIRIALYYICNRQMRNAIQKTLNFSCKAQMEESLISIADESEKEPLRLFVHHT